MHVVVEESEVGSADHTASVRSAPARPPWLLIGVSAAAVLATLYWAIAVARASGRTFDYADDGFYLLSYRWWNVEYRNFTGVQFLYGPVFSLLGRNVAGLRLFRLGTVLATHAALGWNFARWARLRRPHAPATGWWEAAITLVVVASGGLVYTWLPPSPGYNDVSLLAALGLAAIVLAVDRRARLETPVGWWLPALAGVIAVAMLLAKWSSSIVTLAVVALTLVLVLRHRGWAAIARAAAWASGGAVFAVAALAVVIDLPRFVGDFLEVNRAVGKASNSAGGLLRIYAESVWLSSGRSFTSLTVLVPLVAGIVVVTGRHHQRLAAGIVAVGFATAAGALWRSNGLRGSAAHIDHNVLGPVALIASALVILGLPRLTATATRWRRRRDQATPAAPAATSRNSTLPVVGMLLVLPVTQAAGTGNGIVMMAIVGFGAWACVIVHALTALTAPGLVDLRRATLAACLLLSTLAVPAVIGRSSAWDIPYRSAPARYATASTGLAPLDSIRLAPADAALFRELGERLAPWIHPGGRRILAFDEMSGIVFALDGRSVGEPWYSLSDQNRTAAGIAATCSDGPPRWRQPVIINRRILSQGILDAMATCGIHLDDYRQLPVSQALTDAFDIGQGFQILVPK